MLTVFPHISGSVQATTSQRGILDTHLTGLAAAITIFQTDTNRMGGATNPELAGVQTEIAALQTLIGGLNMGNYDVASIRDIVKRAKALEKTLKKARASIVATFPGIVTDFDHEILNSAALRETIKAADTFDSKAIGGIVHHTTQAAGALLGKSVRATPTVLKYGLGGIAATALVGGAYIVGKKGIKEAFVPPGQQEVTEGGKENSFDFRGLYEAHLAPKAGTKVDEATVYHNFWQALRDATSSRAGQLVMKQGMETLKGIELGDTLQVMTDRDIDGREVIAITADATKEGVMNTYFWYCEGGKIMYTTGAPGSQYTSMTLPEMRAIIVNLSDFLGPK